MGAHLRKAQGSTMSTKAGPDLRKYMDKKLAIKLNGNRHVTGTLRGFDQFLNIVLDNTHFPKITVSPDLTSSGIIFPLSSLAPFPTAIISPCIGFLSTVRNNNSACSFFFTIKALDYNSVMELEPTAACATWTRRTI